MEPAGIRKHRKFLTPSKPLRTLIPLLCFIAGTAGAQQSRITRAINNQERFTLSGNIHPRATAENDRGRVAPTLKLSYITLNFNQSAAQKAELTQLLADQQNPKSANYHQWLTPEQYADRFGISQNDLNSISAWLQGQGLTVLNVGRGRTWIAVSGTAAQVENAFQTEIHQYQVDGVTHFANAGEPSVPAAIGSVVLGIRGLSDFRMKPLNVKHHDYSNEVCGGNCLAPADVATIYDINPLYNQGITGAGQKIAVAGQTDIYTSDITTFRSSYGLPTAAIPCSSSGGPCLQQILIPGSPDPGVQNATGDLAEADLDLEWSGGVAKNAAILFVYAEDVMSAVQYAIDEDLAPVVSTSYGSCEPETPQSDVLQFQSWAQQGNSEGITWFNASGDDGAADCDDRKNPGLAVDTPGSVPEVTAVGGTEFAEGSGNYWSSTVNATTGLSALSYIPETSWNDSAEDGMPSASGGGASIYFLKPSWQAGTGVPADNARDVPDVSLSASADHDPYLVYSDGSLQAYGGTSVSAQVFAGIGALMNQYLISNGKQTAAGMGNLNATLYPLAQSKPGSFHDITTGNNIVTSQGCNGRASSSCTPVGYYAGVGFDEVTGLGSVDVCYLATGSACSGTVTTPPPSTVSLTLLSNLTSLATSDQTFLIATATNSTGVTPVGDVVFTAGSTALGSATLVGSNGVATATLAVTGAQIGLTSTGSETVTATYNGSSSTVTASATLSGRATSASNGTPSIKSINNAGSYAEVYAPGEIVAVFGSNLSPSTTSTSSVPFPLTMAGVSATINGEAVPLWFLSPAQMNIQIPYEATVGANLTLEINNNGAVTSQNFLVSSAAPGIFTAANTTNIANGLAAPEPGTETTLYVTGVGAVTPSIATGAAPALSTPLSDLPAPTQNVTVTVNNVPATVNFDGIIWGLVGVDQINFIVPAGTPAGTVPVVVKVGTATATANLIVQ